jgi:ATP-dependent RNA helicase DDX10/DBP4
VKDLARLSLDAPEYLSVHSDAATPTPLKLTQAYMVVSLGQKMDVLWGFIKTHLTAKTIVFLSTCKQVCEGWTASGRFRLPLGWMEGVVGRRTEG